MVLKRLGIIVGLSLTFCQVGHATQYFVDYANGNDDASGESATRSWRHAPGDPAAAGKPAKVKLQPGDVIRFRGGVSYRGNISINAGGAAGQPLTFTGEGFGPGRATIDGADPVQSVAPCPSEEACGGAATWQKLVLIRYARPPIQFIKFFDATGQLYEAQAPKPKDPFFSDQLEEYATAREGDNAKIEGGRLRAPKLVRLLGGQPQGTLSFWVAGNQVARRAVTSIEGDDLLFQPNGLKLFDNGPARYALLGAAAAISGPGQYAVIAPGVAVAQLREGGGSLTVGSGRNGFDVGGRSYVTISGFVFAHQTAQESVYHQGMAILGNLNAASNLILTHNEFRDSAMWNGEGAITLRNFSNVTISDNLLEGIERGSGMRIGDNVTQLVVSRNHISRIGRTGIIFTGVTDGEISENLIDGLLGIHGNGISLYLANRRVKVTDNRVLGTTRPMTFEGDESHTAPGDHDFLIERNIMFATGEGRAALTSWGGATRGVTVRQNLLVGPEFGILLHGSDTGIVVTDNLLSGLTIVSEQGQKWRVQNNSTVGTDYRLNDTPAGHAALCSRVKVPAGSSIGGWAC
jgi:hypothetical protein